MSEPNLLYESPQPYRRAPAQTATSEFPEAVLKALRSGLESTAIKLAVVFGFRDESRLASLVFYARHPERGGQPIQKSEPGFKALSQEWLDIRDRLVRPALSGVAPAPGPSGGTGKPKGSAQIGQIRRLAETAERAGAPPGFATFAVAVAFTESGWKNTAQNKTQHEVESSCRLYHGARKRGYFSGNPHPASDWCIGSGGWFGLMPATGLAAGGKNGPFANGNPRLVFDPAASVVMLASFVRAMVIKYGADSWLAVRRGMASPGLVKDKAETHERSLGVRSRLEKALRMSGADPGFLFKRPDVSRQPDASELFRRLRAGTSGSGQELEAEFPDDSYTRRVINSSIDVKAQRALISMLNSGNPTMVMAAESIIDWVELKRLRGVYQPDQKVPALAARDRGENWWEMLKGKNARVFCASPASLPILIFRKDIDQASLIAIFLAVVRRDSAVGGRCSISTGLFCGTRACETLFTF